VIGLMNSLSARLNRSIENPISIFSVSHKDILQIAIARARLLLDSFLKQPALLYSVIEFN
jgi:hypothetical protein